MQWSSRWLLPCRASQGWKSELEWICVPALDNSSSEWVTSHKVLASLNGTDLVLGWPKSPCGFFHKIKETFFIFTNNYWFGYFEYVSSLRRGRTLIVLNSCLDWIPINFNWSTLLLSIIQWEISSRKLHRPLLTHLLSHSTFPIHCTNPFLHFSCIFTFLELIKHNMLKISLILFHLQCWNGHTKIHQF